LDNPLPFGALQEARRAEYYVRQVLDYKPQYRENSELLALLLGTSLTACSNTTSVTGRR
jgi:hypothetical protein